MNAPYVDTVLQLLSRVRSFGERHEGHSCRFLVESFRNKLSFLCISRLKIIVAYNEPRRNENTVLCFPVSVSVSKWY